MRPEHVAETNAILNKIKPHRDRYEAVAAKSKVPWHVIAIIHSLEGGLSFGTHLHNGDPLTARTVHVPAGRPAQGHPPFTWEESAADALMYDGMTGWTDWSISGTLYKLERFNGAGYHDDHPEVLSPYLWSYSNHYTKGKYGSDGHFDPNLVSKQCGGAVLLKLMEDMAVIGLKTPPALAIPLVPLATPLLTTASVGGGNFYTDVIRKDPRFNSTECINDMNLLEPVTRAAVEAILVAGKAEGLELMVFETYRSQARQKELFKQGSSQLQTVGVHHYGLACDIVKSIHGVPSWKGDFSFLRKLAKDQKLIWGGDWGTPAQPHTFIDDDHVQRITIAKQHGLFAGAWYPDASYNPYNELPS